jgi:hypothetical protein
MMRSHVKIRFRAWWEECEAPPSRSHNSDVLDGIVVRCDLRRIADPQARFRRGRNQWHWMRPAKSRKVAFREHALCCHRTRPVTILLLTKSGDNPGDIPLSAYEIE